MDKIETFVNRLDNIGIRIKLLSNHPWIYITHINNKIVIEKYRAEHGFTLAFLPVRINNNKIEFTEISEIFKLIRKYI